MPYQSGQQCERSDVSRPYNGEMPGVERSHACHAEAFRQRYDAGVGSAKREVGILVDQMSVRVMDSTT
jgi:hypothetical protein